MKADNITLQGILNSPNRYIIPVFQRYYSWQKPEWSQLWENILELREKDALPNHFMGALVFVPEEAETNHPSYLIIDGQQRLVTLSILLCSLRNLARSHDCPELAAEITDTYLLHPYRRGTLNYRLYPRQRDRDEYLALVRHAPYKGERSRITEALVYFLREIQALLDGAESAEAVLRDLFDLLAMRLGFVHITLDGENPYRIFKSLNSTGVNLSEADLIRNFVLMQAGTNTAVQDEFDDNHWQPLEAHFTDDTGQLDTRQMSAFFRDFLMSNGRYIPLAATFYHFERRYSQPETDMRVLTDTLAQYAIRYNYIRGLKAHPQAKVNRVLHRLRLANANAASPFLLALLQLLDEGKLSVKQLMQMSDHLLNFLLQRQEAEEPTRPYPRWFATACRTLEDGKDPSANWLAFLVSKGYSPPAKA